MAKKNLELTAIVAKTRSGNELLDIQKDSDEIWDRLMLIQEHVFDEKAIEGPDGIYRCYLRVLIEETEDEPKQDVYNFEVAAQVMIANFGGLY